MTIPNQQAERQALKDLVDTFSNLADEKRVAEQMPLFTEDAQVTTYIGGKLFADMKGRAEIEKVFSDFLANFHGSMPFCVELDNLKDTDAPIHQPAAMLVAAD